MGVGEWVAGSGLDQSSDQWEADEPAGRPRTLSEALRGDPRRIQPESRQSRAMHAPTHPHMQAEHASHGSGNGEGKKALVVLALVFPCQSPSIITLRLAVSAFPSRPMLFPLPLCL